MSVYLHVTLEVHAAGMQKFIATTEEILPIVEGEGWRLVGAYVQRTGRLNTVIDLWELEDYNHYGRGTGAIGKHPRARELVAALAETVQSETIVFADKVPYSR